MTLALATVYSCQQHEEFDRQLIKENDFFEYSGNNETINGIVTMMEQKNDSVEYVSTYQDIYGQPLWNESLSLPYDECILTVVPVLHDNDDEFETLWVFYQVGERVNYYTFSKRPETGQYSANYWMFDYFTQNVMHQMPKSGTVVGDNSSNTKTDGAVIIEYCSTVTTGYIHEGNYVVVEKRQEQCWTDIIWPDNHIDPPKGGTGTGEAGVGIMPPIGGGSTSHSGGDSGGDNDRTSFEKTKDFVRIITLETDHLTPEQKEKVKEMYNKIAEDCVGQALLVSLGKVAADGKIGIEFTAQSDAYNPSTNRVKIRSGANSNEFFHELFHAYQAANLMLSDWTKRKLNLELEVHYIQHLYCKKHNEQYRWSETTDCGSSRMNTVCLLENFIDASGHRLPEVSVKDAEGAVDAALWGISTHEAYCNYKCVSNFSLEFNFSNLQELSKNC